VPPVLFGEFPGQFVRAPEVSDRSTAAVKAGLPMAAIAELSRSTFVTFTRCRRSFANFRSTSDCRMRWEYVLSAAFSSTVRLRSS
jgi:hypothetical protein